MCWATFWSIFLQTHLVTLLRTLLIRPCFVSVRKKFKTMDDRFFADNHLEWKGVIKKLGFRFFKARKFNRRAVEAPD
jgi:hypothetical protein